MAQTPDSFFCHRGARRAPLPTQGLRALLRWRNALPLFALTLGLVFVAQGLYIPAKAVVAQLLLDRAYERSLVDATPHRAWPWADGWPLARLSAPAHGINQIILSGGNGQALAFGPTVVAAGPNGMASAVPGATLFAQGTTILAGHRDTHFRFLKDLSMGDLITVQTITGEQGSFRVSGQQIVHKDRYVPPAVPSGEILALTTCWPFDSLTQGPWRYVIHAQRVHPQ